MKKKSSLLKSPRRLKPLQKVLIYVLLFLLASVMLYPFLLIINISLKATGEYYSNPIGIVQEIKPMNYVEVFNQLQIMQKFIVTIILSTVASLITVLAAALAAYPISRFHFKSSKIIYAILLASMFFPSSLIAKIVLMKDILMVYGSPIALILIWSIGGLQLYIFMFVGFLKQIPRELEEAAVMDGSGYFKTYFFIIFPLMKPIVATVFILKIISTWNDFLSPYIYVSNPAYRTMATGLYTYMGQFSSKWNYLSVSIVIVALPMFILYLVLQRYIIDGIASGAIKG